jgi:hypothetical protein
MAMTVEIKGNKLCIEIDLEKPTPSASGKTLVVASTRGNAVTTAMVDGKPIAETAELGGSPGVIYPPIYPLDVYYRHGFVLRFIPPASASSMPLVSGL